MEGFRPSGCEPLPQDSASGEPIAAEPCRTGTAAPTAPLDNSPTPHNNRLAVANGTPAPANSRLALIHGTPAPVNSGLAPIHSTPAPIIGSLAFVNGTPADHAANPLKEREVEPRHDPDPSARIAPDE